MKDKLNSSYSIDNAVIFEVGNNDFVKFKLNHHSGSSCEAYLYGAHITSWIVPEFGELLFMSNKAEFQDGKAIRGGIPVIFPQFGGGELPSHGFARNREWQVVESGIKENKDVFMALELEHNADTHAIWPYKFKFRLEINLSEKLCIRINIKNIDDKQLSFQQALHTYFKISDISDVSVSGLKDIRYIDKVNNNNEVTEQQSEVKFTTAFDRVYLSTPDTVRLDDPGLNRKFIVQKQNMADSILWNPWESSKNMKDMHENAYQEMICVECGNVVPKVELKPGENFSAEQQLIVQK